MRKITYKDVYSYFSSRGNIKKFIENSDFFVLLELQQELNCFISEWERQQDKKTAG
ncbi:hypothetical protein KZ126_004997 [Salmonella enterica]|nr:hypothetical protein [Salmonella enterica]EHV2061154.1 hypothetical protein [Salmonella enterica]